MTLTCGICKTFMAAAGAIRCENNNQHMFHPECIRSHWNLKINSDTEKIREDLCTLCEESELSLLFDPQQATPSDSLIRTENDSLKYIHSSI